ncbi:uncharacterized protein [Dermacentor andersoni]|uniref:uncharacterized protein n=1 Tax=Dermacentor andersoni TaxID=34620 RepID=UPI0024166E35|nr:uncharacterized protein LOC126536817 [Dermacentor andersoni]
MDSAIRVDVPAFIQPVLQRGPRTPAGTGCSYTSAVGSPTFREEPRYLGPTVEPVNVMVATLQQQQRQRQFASVKVAPVCELLGSPSIIWNICYLLVDFGGSNFGGRCWVIALDNVLLHILRRSRRLLGLPPEDTDMNEPQAADGSQDTSMQDDSTQMVNLTEEAKQYVEKQNTSGKIDSWGLSGYYEYWIQQEQERKGHYIFATTESLKCVPEANAEGLQFGKDIRSCTEEFSLFITEGMTSPFRAITEVNFPLMGKAWAGVKKPVRVDLNNQTQIFETIREVPYRRSEMRSCTFKVNVTLQGQFAYHMKRDKVEDGEYVPVVVGVLANKTKKLYNEGDRLVYTIIGSYNEKVCVQ